MPFITVNDGTRLAYRVEGGEGPPVLLVHGWSGSQDYFQQNVPALCAASLQVITYDQRFHGESDKPAHGHHVARLAADLHGVVTELGLEDVTLVGGSMGCAVIWSYFELFAGANVARAVFIDQAPLQNTAPDWTTGSKGIYDGPSLARLQAALHTDMNAFSHGNLEVCATLPIDESIAKSLHAATMQCNPTDLAKLMADHTQLDWRSQLPRITVPCLNIIGCRSGVFPVEGCEAVGSLIPGCKTVYFAEANHWLYLEAPDAFNAILADFVKTGSIDTLPEGTSAKRPT